MSNNILMDGLTDAAGFLCGALAGFGLAHLLGFDIFAEGYGVSSMGGILLVGAGGGLGVQLARHWRSRKTRL